MFASAGKIITPFAIKAARVRGLAEPKTETSTILAGDPFRAKQEIQKRVKELRLKPIDTPDGVAFEVTGDIRLVAAEDSVMLGTSSSVSAKHYISVLPFSATVYHHPEWSRAA